MQITRVQIPLFKALDNVDIDFSSSLSPQIFPLGSQNGGGKSTLLQTIFTLLFCFRDEGKHQYIRNLLDGEAAEVNPSSSAFFCKLEILHGELKLELQFSIKQSVEYPENGGDIVNFSEFKSAREIREELEVATGLAFLVQENHQILVRFINSRSTRTDETEIINLILDALSCLSGLSESLISKEYKESFQSISARFGQDDDYDIRELVSFLDEFGSELQRKCVEIRERRLKNKEKLELLQNWLAANKSQHICSLSDSLDTFAEASPSLVLAFASSPTLLDPDSILDLIPKRIYLAAPPTHMFLSLAREDRENVFKLSSSGGGLAKYYSALEDLKRELVNLFTYDFIATELLIKIFKEARDKDFKIAIESGEYGNNYKQIVNDIKRLLGNKSIRVSPDLTEISFESAREGENMKLLPENLSHGELKRLSLYIWLKHEVSEDSIVLMDEVEIALHPDWQYRLIDDLSSWEPENQYILATHSYELCEALTPAHVKELEPKLRQKASTTVSQ